MSTFSIAHATARPLGWQDSFKSSKPSFTTQYVLSVDRRFGSFAYFLEDYPYRPDVLAHLSPNKPKNAVSNWINAIDHCTGGVILVNSDDFRFPADWEHRLFSLTAHKNPQVDPFVVHVSTGAPRDHELMTFQIMSRALINRWGYALWPEYDGMYVDDDFTKHAYQDPGVEVIQARQLVFEHLHFAFGKAKYDEVYAHENRTAAKVLGASIYKRRLANNFKEEITCV